MTARICAHPSHSPAGVPLLSAAKGFILLVLLLGIAQGQPVEQALGSEEDILLAFKATVENWDEVYATRHMRGWQACHASSCQPLCSWTGVTCDPFSTASGGQVTALELPCDPASCTVPAVGRLAPQLAQLQHLQRLDLSGNAFYGDLPVEWALDGTFPKLADLILSSNNLSGQLPEAWAVNAAFLSLVVLNLADNHLSGPLHTSWATTNISFINLVVWNLANNELTGPLPPYMNGIIVMSSVSFQGNKFTGPIPSGWGTQGWLWNNTYNSTQTLEELYLHGNLLTGGLPVEWAAPNSFTTLQHLTLSQNALGGSFPAAWLAQGSWASLQTLNISHAGLHGTLPPAAGGSMPSLKTLAIDTNALSGTIPPSWAALPSLSWVEIQPGNPDLCTQLPANASFQLCNTDDRHCFTPLLPSNNTACGGQGGGSVGGSEGGGSSSGVPVIAIAIPLVAAAALAAAAAGFLLLRRKRRAKAMEQKQLFQNAKGGGGSNSTDSKILAEGAAPVFPPSELTFHEEGSVWAGALGLGTGRRPRAGLEMYDVPSDKLPSEEHMEMGAAAQQAEQGTMAPQPPSSRGSQRSSCLPCMGVAAEQDLLAPVQLSNNSTASGKLTPLPASRSRENFEIWRAGQAQTAQQQEQDCLVPVQLSNNSTASSALTPLPAARGRQSSEPSWTGQAQATQQQQQQHSDNATESSAGFGSGGHGGSNQEPAWPHDTRPVAYGSKYSGSRSGGSRGGGEGTSCEEAAWHGTVRASFEVENLLMSDWEIQPEEIEILKRPDGSPWQLGAGGFGTVYKAMRNGVQPVAVKVISSHIDELQRMSQEEFQREIAILRACRDTNIVQFLGVCIQPDKTMLVTEYMEGGNLFSNIRQKKVSWYRRGKRIAVEVARGMAFLHSKRIVHLDMKTANVLLTREGSAKVSDMGLSRIMAKGQSAVTGAFGTLAWSAPEMLWGQKCTTKADIYSYGIVLWEIVTGEVPVRGQLRDVRVPEECPDVVRDIILYCLEPNPSSRPTAVQLVEWLFNAPAVPPAQHASSAPEPDRPEGSQGSPPGRVPSASSTPAAATAAAALLPAEMGQVLQLQQQDPHCPEHQEQPYVEGQGGDPEQHQQQEQQPASLQATVAGEHSLSSASPFAQTVAQMGAANLSFSFDDAPSPRSPLPPSLPPLPPSQQRGMHQGASSWQRTASRLLPVQAGLADGAATARGQQRQPQDMQRASSRIPSPFDHFLPQQQQEEEAMQHAS